MKNKAIKTPFFPAAVTISITMGSLVALFALVLIALGIALRPLHPAIFYSLLGVMIFFGVLAVIPLAFIKYAYVDEAGIELCSLFRRIKKLEWSEIVEIGFVDVYQGIFISSSSLYFKDDPYQAFMLSARPGMQKTSVFGVNKKRMPIALPVSEYLIDRVRKNAVCPLPDTLK